VLHAYERGEPRARALQTATKRPVIEYHFGTGNKFITPTVADGKVFVGTTAGVAVFGLLHWTRADPAAPDIL